MPRQAREKSQTGTYHIMLRGINQQQIFEDRQDYEKLLDIIADCKEISGYKVIAYCLMGNHIHLLLRLEKEDCGLVMKRICTRFVYWYNLKYNRVGHLFQDRYKSEPVDDESYLLMATSYIHQNPLKAGLSKSLEYEYSSYNAYAKKEYSGLVDRDEIFKVMNQSAFLELQKELVKERFLDIEENTRPRLTDEGVCLIMKKKFKCAGTADFQALPVAKRDKSIKILNASGASIRQISRLTGVSIGVVRRIIVE